MSSKSHYRTSESPSPNAGNESKPSSRPVCELHLPVLEKRVQSRTKSPKAHEAHTGLPKSAWLKTTMWPAVANLTLVSGYG